jgi:hypothetical protein
MEKRLIERANVAELPLLFLTIESQGHEPLEARVLDASGHGLSAVTKDPTEADGELRGEVVLRLRLATEDFSLRAEVRHHSRVGERDRYGFEFLDPDELDTQGASVHARRIFDRRLCQRVYLEREDRLTVSLDDEANDVHVQGKMMDVSAGGACLQVPKDDMPGLDASERILVEFTLPGLQASVRVPGVICRRRPTMLAVEFDFESSELSFTREAILDFVAQRVAVLRPTG